MTTTTELVERYARDHFRVKEHPDGLREFITAPGAPSFDAYKLAQRIDLTDWYLLCPECADDETAARNSNLHGLSWVTCPECGDGWSPAGPPPPPHPLFRPRAANRASAQPIGYVHGQPVYPIKGSRRGYSTEGDVLVNQTADGVDLNDIWAEHSELMEVYNGHKDALVSHLTYNTVRVSDLEPQSLAGARPEEASEFGIPRSSRVAADYIRVSYDFRDFDWRAGFTWKFLRDADSRQVAAMVQNILDGDREHNQNRVLWQLLLNTERSTEDLLSGAVHSVYPLYNGDGMVPPSYMGQDFTAPHSHFLTTQGELDASDIESAIETVTEHGFGQASGSQLLILANPAQGGLIQGFRAGTTNADSTVAQYDFIPSTGAPPYLTSETIVGDVPPGEFGGLKIAGALGPAWLVESRFIPAGYLAVVATGGPGSDMNPVAFREHSNPAYRGLRQLPGNQRAYPLIDSYFARGFGVGVRRRGAAAVVQVTDSTVTDYTPPAFDLP